MFNGQRPPAAAIPQSGFESLTSATKSQNGGATNRLESAVIGSLSNPVRGEFNLILSGLYAFSFKAVILER